METTQVVEGPVRADAGAAADAAERWEQAQPPSENTELVADLAWEERGGVGEELDADTTAETSSEPVFLDEVEPAPAPEPAVLDDAEGEQIAREDSNEFLEPAPGPEPAAAEGPEAVEEPEVVVAPEPEPVVEPDVAPEPELAVEPDEASESEPVVEPDEASGSEPASEDEPALEDGSASEDEPAPEAGPAPAPEPSARETKLAEAVVLLDAAESCEDAAMPRAAALYQEAIVCCLDASEDPDALGGVDDELLRGFDGLSSLLARGGLAEEALGIVDDAVSLGLLDGGEPGDGGHREALRVRREDLRRLLFADSSQL